MTGLAPRASSPFFVLQSCRRREQAAWRVSLAEQARFCGRSPPDSAHASIRPRSAGEQLRLAFFRLRRERGGISILAMASRSRSSERSSISGFAAFPGDLWSQTVRNLGESGAILADRLRQGRISQGIARQPLHHPQVLAQQEGASENGVIVGRCADRRVEPLQLRKSGCHK
jgi:hypothetical protein